MTRLAKKSNACRILWGENLKERTNWNIKGKRENNIQMDVEV